MVDVPFWHKISKGLVGDDSFGTGYIDGLKLSCLN